MAAFSHLHHPFLLDSVFALNGFSNINVPALTLPQERHQSLTSSDFSHLDFEPYSAVQHPHTSYAVPNQEPNFPKDSVSGTKVTFSHDSGPSITKRNSNDEASAVLDSQKESFVEKSRKFRRGSSLSPTKAKIATQGKSKRQKKSNGAMQGEKKKTKAEKKVSDELPTGYIHVRAKRGQATDSHSLAERVRREKISERMRILQRLVPGCDKVTGKALMLDEIINYVQSLQNQVEFLSMRLTSLNPTLYDFTMDLDTSMVGQEKLDNRATCRPNLHPTAFANVNADTTTATPAATSTMSNTFTFTPDGNDHRFTPLSNSTPVLVQGQRANFMGEESACCRRRLCWDIDDQRQKYLDRGHQQQLIMQWPPMELTQDTKNYFSSYN